jgi:hypothetical protein
MTSHHHQLQIYTNFFYFFIRNVHIRAIHWGIKLCLCYFEEQKLYSKGFKYHMHMRICSLEISNLHIRKTKKIVTPAHLHTNIRINFKTIL